MIIIHNSERFRFTFEGCCDHGMTINLRKIKHASTAIALIKKPLSLFYWLLGN